MPVYYSTSQVCSALGISRATLYNWDVRPDFRAPGVKGTLGWTAKTIRKLAVQHGREVDETILSEVKS